MAANRSEVKMEDKMLLLVAAEARQAWEQSRCKVAAHHKRIDTIRRVAEDPSQLEFLSAVQQEDRVIVLAALKNSRDGGELRYASTTLQRDTELRAIAREALESSFEEQVETLLTGAKALDLEIPAIVVEKVRGCAWVTIRREIESEKERERARERLLLALSLTLCLSLSLSLSPPPPSQQRAKNRRLSMFSMAVDAASAAHDAMHARGYTMRMTEEEAEAARLAAIEAEKMAVVTDARKSRTRARALALAEYSRIQSLADTFSKERTPAESRKLREEFSALPLFRPDSALGMEEVSGGGEDRASSTSSTQHKGPKRRMTAYVNFINFLITYL